MTYKVKSLIYLLCFVMAAIAHHAFDNTKNVDSEIATTELNRNNVPTVVSLK